MAEDGRQKADDRKQMTEDRDRKLESGLRPIGAYAYAPAGMRNNKEIG
jgi:hypothetical protein